MINLSMAVYSPDNIFRSTTGGPASGIEWLLEGVLEKCVDFYSIENSEASGKSCPIARHLIHGDGDDDDRADDD